MGNTTTALVFVLALNMIMFVAQAVMLDANPSGNRFYDYQGSLIQNLNKGNETNPSLSVDTASGNLPSSKPIVTSTGNLFVDIFNSIKSWFGSTLGNNYFVQLLRGPYDILTAIHLPPAISFAIGGFWYAISFFVVLSYFWGKDN